jgi:hypothetical protein
MIDMDNPGGEDLRASMMMLNSKLSESHVFKIAKEKLR